MPNQWFDLKSRLHAGYVYNPSKPPFKCASLLFVAAVRQNKHVCSALTLIATLRREACCKSAIYLTCGECNVCLHSSLRHAINSVQIEKLRNRRSSLEGADAFLLSLGNSVWAGGIWCVLMGSGEFWFRWVCERFLKRLKGSKTFGRLWVYFYIPANIGEGMMRELSIACVVH